MNNSSSGKMSGRALDGKGFYIVLFLCAAVIGMSVWAMSAGSETMYEDAMPVSAIDDARNDTELIPQVTEQPLPVIAPDTELGDELIEQLYPEGATAEEAAAVYIRPVDGDIDRSFCRETLSYDKTMADWRTHDAVDIRAQVGSPVVACHAGTVQAVYNDSLLGTVMVIDHGNGMTSSYANLDDTAVGAGAWVSAGAPIATVGSSALGESGQEAHLHFSMAQDGIPVNPMDYLSE